MGSIWSSPMRRSQPFASFARSRNNRASLPQLSAYIRQDERNSLSRKNLHVVRGIPIRQEKTVPLDKFTDMAMFHGPIMRHFGLRGLSVETAGRSDFGSLIKLIGIEGTEDFRTAVLAQHERIGGSDGASSTPSLVAAAAHCPRPGTWCFR